MTAEEASYLVCDDLEPVRQFLQNALKMKSRGETHHFNHIVEQLKSRSDPDLLWKIFLGLVSSVSFLTQRPEDYSDLIHNLFSYNWMMQKKINVAFMNLINHLISANSVYFIPALQLVVKSLVNLSSFVPEKSSGAIADEVRSILHRTLRHAVTLVPTGIVEVIPVLSFNFPFRRQSAETISGYVAELLQICEYMPVLQIKILELIVDKCLEIDVEIIVEDSGEVLIRTATEDSSLENGMFDFDELQRDAQVYKETSQQIAAAVVESADKLDTLLTLLVGFIILTSLLLYIMFN